MGLEQIPPKEGQMKRRNSFKRDEEARITSASQKVKSNGRRTFLLFIFLLSFYFGKAQQSNTFYFMNAVPQTSDLNPAFSIPCNYIGLPLISSFHLDVGNTGFSYNQVFPKEGDGRIIDFDYLERRLHNLDLMNAQLQFDIFSLGMWYEDYFLTFKITEHADFLVSYPKNLFLVPWKGNRQYVGETAEIQRFGGDFSYYREFALSASGWVNGDLRLGVRAGLLFGKMNLSTRREELAIHTREDNYHLDASGSYRVNSTLPLDITEDATGNISEIRLRDDIPIRNVLFNGRNPGFNLDLGGIYTGLEEFILYAGLNDLGMMYWTSELNNLEVEQQFRFEGLTPDDLQEDDYPQLMLDSLEDSYETTFLEEPYMTLLPLKSYIGATHQLTERIRAGVLQRNLFYKWRIYPSLTFSLNADIQDFFSVSAAYSYNRYSFSNFGVGFSLQSRRVQFYMVTDNLRAINPLDVRNVNLRFGLNLFFGCGDQRRGDTGISFPGCFWIRQQLDNEKILPQK